jgi:hypothetical protein
MSRVNLLDKTDFIPQGRKGHDDEVCDVRLGAKQRHGADCLQRPKGGPQGMIAGPGSIMWAPVQIMWGLTRMALR